MRKKVGIIKRAISLLLVFLLSINSFAAIVSDNDGSAFITKAEFDSLKNSFQSQIDSYNQSIDSKIDGAIASYLAGIRVATKVALKSYLDESGMYGTKILRWNCYPSCVRDIDANKYPLQSLDILIHQINIMVRYGFEHFSGNTGWEASHAYYPSWKKLTLPDGAVAYQRRILGYLLTQKYAEIVPFANAIYSDTDARTIGPWICNIQGMMATGQGGTPLTLANPSCKYSYVNDPYRTTLTDPPAARDVMYYRYQQIYWCDGSMIDEDDPNNYLLINPACTSTNPERCYDSANTDELIWGGNATIKPANPDATAATARMGGYWIQDPYVVSSFGNPSKADRAVTYLGLSANPPCTVKNAPIAPWLGVSTGVNLSKIRDYDLMQVDNRNSYSKKGIVIADITKKGQLEIEVSIGSSKDGKLYLIALPAGTTYEYDQWSSHGGVVTNFAANDTKTITINNVNKNDVLWLCYIRNTSDNNYGIVKVNSLTLTSME